MRKGQAPTSSEKLLRLIRGANATALASRDEAASRAVSADTPKRRGKGILPFFGGRAVVGVDVGRRGIAVATLRRRDGDFEILALEKAILDPSVVLDSEEFSRILSSVVSRACLQAANPEIWCTISSSQADMSLVGVPPVPSSQLDNAVFWTARKELSFDEKNVVFDYENRGEMVDKGAVKNAVFVHTVPREAVERRKAAFARAGLSLTGMTLTAFADQNVFRSGCLPPPPGGAATLHVGENWTRLEIFRDGNLVFTRGIKSAMTALSAAVQEGLAEAAPAPAPVFDASRAPVAPEPLTLDFVGGDEVVLDLDDDAPAPGGNGEAQLLTLDLSGSSPLTTPPVETLAGDENGDAPRPAAAETTAGVNEEAARTLLLSLVEGAPEVPAGQPGHGLSREEIFDLADPALSRLARQVEMTLKHYRETLGNDPVGALYVSGPLAAAPEFLEYLEGHLGIPCEPFDPMGGAENRRHGHGLDPAAMTLAGRCAYQQALGVALSLPRITPNLFVTYKERREARRVHLVNRSVVAVFLLLVAMVAGYTVFETGRNRDRSAELASLKAQEAKQGVMVDTALLNKTAVEAKKNQEAIKAFAAKNLGLGAISELTSLTPSAIKIISLTVDMGPPVRDQAPKAPAAKPSQAAKAPVKYVKKLIIDGIVEGDNQLFESVLAGYLVNLQNSPLIGDSTVSKRDVETIGGVEALHFVASLTLAGQ